MGTGNARAGRPVPYPTGPTNATAVHHLSYYGGPVMAYEQNVLVLWGSHTDANAASKLNGLLTAMRDSGSANPYNIPLQYGTQGVSSLSLPAPRGLAPFSTTSDQPLTNDSDYSGNPVQIAPAPCSGTTSCIVTDAQIQTELRNQIDAGILPAPTQAFGGPVTYYSILFPGNVQICMDGPCSGVDFCAYHGTEYLNPGAQTGTFMYGIIPSGPTTSMSGGCGANANYLNNLTSYFSHELVETITDPLVGFAQVVGFPLAWYDPTSGGGEIGDICNASQANVSYSVGTAAGTYVLQNQFSNPVTACVSSWTGHNALLPNFTVSGAGLTRSFNASASSSPNGPGGTNLAISGYLWDFGDGLTGTGATPSHTFASSGTYRVQLIVTDSANVSARKAQEVVVTAPSPPPPPPPPPPSPPPPPPPPGPPPPPFKPPCVVPNVIGKTLAKATRALNARHCRLGTVSPITSTLRKKGHVVRESPAAGRHLRNNVRVSLWLGKGPRRK